MTDLDRAILALEARWYRHPGSKVAAIRDLGLTETGYWMRVRDLASSPAAAAEFPMVVASIQRRLRRAA